MIKNDMKLKKVNVFITCLCFVITCFLPIVKAQDKMVENQPLPLKLQLKVDNKNLGQDLNIYITGRLENISDKVVVIDKRNLWRFVSFKSYPKENSEKANQPFFESLKIPRYMFASGDNLEEKKIPKEYLLVIKPKEYYEDALKISLKDSFFQTPGKYSVKSAYRQFKKQPSKKGLFFVGEIESNELEFNISDNKILR